MARKQFKNKSNISLSLGRVPILLVPHQRVAHDIGISELKFAKDTAPQETLKRFVDECVGPEHAQDHKIQNPIGFVVASRMGSDELIIVRSEGGSAKRYKDKDDQEELGNYSISAPTDEEMDADDDEQDIGKTSAYCLRH